MEVRTEKYRIDLSVRDKEREFALIFENKIHNAVFQKNQLARYIMKLGKEGFKQENIYVVYLPTSSDYETNDCCWRKPEPECESCYSDCKFKSSKNELREYFEKNGLYRKITFRDGIINWLKEDVYPNLLVKENLLQASVLLYVDYLEGMFNLRTIEKEMYNEIENKIVNKLQWDESTKLETKCDDLKELITTIEAYEKEKRSIMSIIDKIIMNMLKCVVTGWDAIFYEETADLILKHNGFTIYIGLYNQKIYYSIKTDSDLNGNGKVIKQLDIFKEPADRWNSYGWQRIDDIPYWGTRIDFVNTMLKDVEFKTQLIKWIDRMKKTIDDELTPI